MASHSSAQQPGSLDELSHLKTRLKAALRQFPDFPSPGILFEDIMPIFADVELHAALIRALELHVLQMGVKPDVVVGLDARGFLFGPSLALRLGAGFAPVRKQGKLPGECATVGYKKEYGEDFFQMQVDAVKPGQKVLIVDDIIATGEFRPDRNHNLEGTASNDCMCRWLGCCCGPTREEVRRHRHGIRVPA